MQEANTASTVPSFLEDADFQGRLAIALATIPKDQVIEARFGSMTKQDGTALSFDFLVARLVARICSSLDNVIESDRAYKAKQAAKDEGGAGGFG